MLKYVLAIRDENGFEIFRNSGYRFRFFPIGLVGNGIFGNGIGCRNFNSESVSKTIRRSTDRLYRLPILIGIYRILVSEFPEISKPASPPVILDTGL
jgi:hypothetical protein